MNYTFAGENVLTPKPTSRVAKANYGSQMCVIALAVLAGLAYSVPAGAATYQFAVPSTLIQSALTMGMAIPSVNKDPNLYASYEFYVRPMLATDLIPLGQAVAGANNGHILLSSTIVDFAPPIPSGPDAYTAGLTIGGPSDGTNPNAHYKYAIGDTLEALLTPNSAVIGMHYESIDALHLGPAAELMPGSANFSITINSNDLFLSGVVRFDVRAVAYQFPDSSAASTVTKSQGFIGFFDLQGTEAPEPGSLFTMSAGIGLLALYGTRRRRARPNSLL